MGFGFFLRAVRPLLKINPKANYYKICFDKLRYQYFYHLYGFINHFCSCVCIEFSVALLNKMTKYKWLCIISGTNFV